MSERLPLFPLGTVLFPGLLLPLHIFEERYRALVRTLTAPGATEPRPFGVVAIKQGRETGVDGIGALHAVGCSAQPVRLTPYDDGRYDVLSAGRRRFRLLELLDSEAPYLVGEVEWLDEPPGEAAGAAVGPAAAAFRAYLEAVGAARGTELEAPDLPDDPVVASYVVAATTMLDLADRQTLLEAADAGQRLQLATGMLRRELALVRAVGTTMAPGLGQGAWSPN